MTIEPSLIVWTVLCFLALVLILKKLLFQPMLTFMDTRNAKIEAARKAKEDARTEYEAEARRLADERAAQEAQYTHCERIVNVRQIEECREIIKYLLRGESVLLNLENIDPKDCGRVVDLLSGAAFALQGRMLKVAHLSYLLAPENVEVIEEDVYAASRMRYR